MIRKPACCFPIWCLTFFRVHLSPHCSASLCFYLEFTQKKISPKNKQHHALWSACTLQLPVCPLPVTPLSETASKTSCIFSQGAYDAQVKVCVTEKKWTQLVIFFIINLLDCKQVTSRAQNNHFINGNMTLSHSERNRIVNGRKLFNLHNHI